MSAPIPCGSNSMAVAAVKQPSPSTTPSVSGGCAYCLGPSRGLGVQVRPRSDKHSQHKTTPQVTHPFLRPSYITAISCTNVTPSLPRARRSQQTCVSKKLRPAFVTHSLCRHRAPSAVQQQVCTRRMVGRWSLFFAAARAHLTPPISAPRVCTAPSNIPRPFLHHLVSYQHTASRTRHNGQM